MPVDKSRYPHDWAFISHYIRFERAGGRCEFCGAMHNQPHPETGKRVILTTAHLDHDTTHNTEDNLRALCQRCHLRHDLALHLKHAAQTRRAKQIQAGQLTFTLEEESTP